MFADGSARFIKDSINVQSWMVLDASSNDEVITADSCPAFQGPCRFWMALVRWQDPAELIARQGLVVL
jgi:hypothetical protein